MLDDQQAAADLRLQRFQALQQLVTLDLIQAGSRLVEQKEPRSPDQGASDCHATFTAVREGGRPHVGMLEQVHVSEHLRRLDSRCARGKLEAEPRTLDVLTNRQRPEESRSLEGPGEPVACAPVNCPPGDVAGAEPHAACPRRLEAAQHIEHRRLAGAVRSDQPEDRVLRELQIDAVDRPQPAEPHVDPLRQERRRAVAAHASACSTCRETRAASAFGFSNIGRWPLPGSVVRCVPNAAAICSPCSGVQVASNSPLMTSAGH